MKKELSYLETLKIIDEIKKYFEKQLSARLSLIKVQSPLFVRSDTGLQDDLSGIEKGVGFTKDKEKYEIVHSLAKWKRDALGRYQFPVHKGILTDMKAIRRDEVVDDIHSMYVEQWDWEQVISKEDRCVDYLKDTVRSINTPTTNDIPIHAVHCRPSPVALAIEIVHLLTCRHAPSTTPLHMRRVMCRREDTIVRQPPCTF